jgi:hypothetical protein
MQKLLHSTPAAKKLGLLAIGVLFCLSVLAVPQPARAFCQAWTDYYTYYSDASHTQQVGWCEFDCYCVTYCDGERTSYYDHSSWSGCL